MAWHLKYATLAGLLDDSPRKSFAKVGGIIVQVLTGSYVVKAQLGEATVRLILALAVLCVLRSTAAGEVETRLTPAQELEWLNKHAMPMFGVQSLKHNDVPNLFELKDNDGEFLNRAYAWLIANQEADGHWDSIKHGAEVEADVEQTSIALLCFLLKGYFERRRAETDQILDTILTTDTTPTPNPMSYAGHIRRGLDWLTSKMKPDGSFSNETHFTLRISRQAMAVSTLAQAVSGQRERAPDAQKATDFLFKDISENATNLNLVHLAMVSTALLDAKIAGLKVPVTCFESLAERVEKFRRAETLSFAFGTNASIGMRANILGSFILARLGWNEKERWRGVISIYGIPNPIDNDCLFNWFACWLNLKTGKVDGRGPFFNATIEPFKKHQQIAGPNKGSVEPHGLWSGTGRVFFTAFGAMLEASRPVRWSWSLEED